MKLKIYATLFLLIFIASSCGADERVVPVSIQHDVTYCIADGIELKMDVYTPEHFGKAPAIIYVHGGGWAKGNKTGSINKDTPELVQAGNVLFAVDYRLKGDNEFPTMIEDIKCAVRSVRAHAEEYNIDPNRIGAFGASSGGHLVALLGATDESAGFDVGQYLEYSSRVQAVAVLFGPTNLAKQYKVNTLPTLLKTFRESDLEAASPINYVSADDPPFLLVHGDHDKVIPLDQSQDFYEKMLSVNAPGRLLVVKNAGHGFGSTNRELVDPPREDVVKMIVDFFAEELK